MPRFAVPVRRDATLGCVDGVIDMEHAALTGSNIDQRLHFLARQRSSVADRHATAIASILVGSAPESVGICPEARVVSCAIACSEFVDGTIGARVAADRIAAAVRSCVSSGAHVVLLSLGFEPDFSTEFATVLQAVDWARHQGVRCVIAAGNHSTVAANPILLCTGAIPVVAARLHADRRDLDPPFDPRMHRQALSAPGDQVCCAWLPSGYRLLDGSSVAAALVAASFTWIFQRVTDATADDIWLAMLSESRIGGASLLPPHIDVEGSLARLMHIEGTHHV